MDNNQADSILYTDLDLGKIEKIVLNLQQEIYTASTKCDLGKVHLLQDILLNAKSTQAVALQIIVKQLEKLYWLYTKEKNVIKDAYKLIFLNKSSINYRDKNRILFVIKEKMKQYTIFLVLKPEWQSKLEVSSLSSSQKMYSKEVETRLSTFFTNYFYAKPNMNCGLGLQLDTIIKYIDKKYLLRKLNTITCIRVYISNWLDSQYFCEFPNITEDSIWYTYGSLYCDQLWILLQKIILSGIEWYLYIRLQFIQFHTKLIILMKHSTCFLLGKDLYYSELGLCIINFMKSIGISVRRKNYTKIKCNVNTIKIADESIVIRLIHSKYSNISLKPGEYCIKKLLQKIKSILYHKNKNNKWRVNKIDLHHALYRTNEILSRFYMYYLAILDSEVVTEINSIVDNLFYSWQIKR
uniref:Reverse transcriptase N-terminal domain-containing protein n=1 Tax=Rhodogorgon sp. TaxID=2485824 RepID=A0A3G3MI37_9FLOR|nr:hypothetical protein [Rhodogorgon sp.]